MAEPLPSIETPVPVGPAAGRPRWVSFLFRLEAAALLLVGLLSVLFYLRAPSRLPGDDDYRRVAGAIAERARPGDVVLLDPHWAERARLFVTGTPVLNLGRHPTRGDLARAERVLLLSLTRVPRSEPADGSAFLESIGFRRSEGPLRSGALALSIFENSKVERPSFDFTAEVASARVYLRRPDGSEEPCQRAGERHRCPRASWIDVGAELKEIAFKPQRCLWAHPAGSDPLVLEWSGVQLGSELRVMGGIVGQIAFRHDHYSTVNLEVKVDGRSLAKLPFPPGEPGERRWSLDTRGLAGPSTVQFEVTAANPDMRHFCFDAGVHP